MNNLIKRSITGFFFGAVLIAGIILHPYSFLLLFALIVVLGMNEFCGLFIKPPVLSLRVTGIILSINLYSISFYNACGRLDRFYFVFLVPLILLIPLIELFRKNANPLQNIPVTTWGVLYIALPFAMLNYLVFIPEGENITFYPEIVLGIFFLTWANDVGAYFVGSSIGRHKMFERISPKKTWEGTIGGAVSAILVSWLISVFFTVLTIVDWIIIAIIVAVMGTLGDLLESMLKRSINIKDSGNLLPGHGGILDRFDSILYASPAIFLYILIKNYFFA